MASFEMPRPPERYVESKAEKKGQITQDAMRFQRELAKNIGEEKLKKDVREKTNYNMKAVEVTRGLTLGKILQEYLPSLKNKEDFFAVLANLGRQDRHGDYLDFSNETLEPKDFFNPHYLEVGEWVSVENGLLLIWNKHPDEEGATIVREANLFNWEGGTEHAVSPSLTLPPP